MPEKSDRAVRLARLSDAVREAERAAAAARNVRNVEIHHADAAGYATREIARWCRVDPGTVLNVLAKPRPDLADHDIDYGDD